MFFMVMETHFLVGGGNEAVPQTHHMAYQSNMTVEEPHSGGE